MWHLICLLKILYSDFPYNYRVEIGGYIGPSGQVVESFNNRVLLIISNHCLCCSNKLRWLEGTMLQLLLLWKQLAMLCRISRTLTRMLNLIAWQPFRGRTRLSS